MSRAIIFLILIALLGGVAFFLVSPSTLHGWGRGGEWVVSTHSVDSSPAPVLGWVESISPSSQSTGAVCITDPQIMILMYHYIRPEVYDRTGSTTSTLSVSPDVFETQMQTLAHLRESSRLMIASMGELEWWYDHQCFPARRIVVLSADDGWVDSYTDLYRITAPYQIPISLSLISARVGSSSGYVSYDQVSEMLHSWRVEILSHSVDHRDFRSLSAPETEAEICDSKRLLEKVYGQKISTFVYPAGHQDRYENEYLQKCWYRFALTTHPGILTGSTLTTHPYDLSRVRIQRGTDFSAVMARFVERGGS